MFVGVWGYSKLQESKQSPCKRVVSIDNSRVDVTLFPKQRYHVPRSKGKREKRNGNENENENEKTSGKSYESANIVFVGFSRLVVTDYARREGIRPGSPMTR